MSRIAEALAKAKQRTGHTTAPFLAGPPAPDPASQLARARRHQRFWITLLSVAALGTALLIWQRLRDTPAPAPASSATTAASGTTTTPSAANPSPPPEQPGALGEPSFTAASDGTIVAAAPATTRAVQALAITAVLPGERPRLVSQGRIISVGETVVPGLVFSGVRDQHLIFTDARGATYERKY